jgi:NAD(P)-dependent dehydrogenase (short-subunit alcohol dehydrogenase family)
MDFGVTGRTALIRGADDGRVRACAQVLAAEGVRVVDAPDDGVDIVVTFAPQGGTDLLDVEEAAELHDAWTSVVEAVATYRELFPGMSSRGWGRFVWVGSAAAKSLNSDGDELSAVVSLAMMAAHKVVAAEGGPTNITANTILRGGSATDDDVAAAVAFLCSQGAGYITGVTITVDGGLGSAVF